jgi:drug/metabolite transporter (DMT)-like permease
MLSAVGFGSGGLFAKPVYAAGVGFLTLLAWRFLIAAALAWASVAVQPGARRAVRSMPRRARLVALGLGVVYVGNSATYYASLETVPLSLAALIVYLYPPVVAVLALRFGRRLHGARAWSALGMALVGVVLALGGIDPDTAPPPLGLALAVASPLIYSCWIILAARLSGERTDRTGSDAAEGAGAAAASALMLSASAAVFWAAALVTATPVLPGSFPAEAWPGILGVAVVATFVAVQSFYAGARRVGAAQASLISTVEPLWTIALAAWLLGERLEPIQWAGGALILAAVVLAQTAGPGPARHRVDGRQPDGQGDGAEPADAGTTRDGADDGAGHARGIPQPIVRIADE